MPKKNTGLKIFGIVLLIVFLVSLVVSVFYFGVVKETGLTGGGILNLQEANFISSDPTINGKAWILLIAQNDLSEFVKGTFSVNEINSQTKDREKVKYPIEVTIKSTPQKCQYRINAQSSKIYTMESVSKGKFILKTSCQNAMQGCDVWTCKPLLGITYFEGYCFVKSARAFYGTLELDKLTFSSDVIAKVNNEEFTGTITNLKREPVSLADGKVYAQWMGSLTSGSQCPSPSGQNIASALIGGTWSLIDNENYKNYLIYDQSGFNDCLDRYAQGTEIPQTCASKYNKKSNLAISSKEFTALGGTSQTQKAKTKFEGGLSDGKAEIELGQAINFPLFRMIIKADILGIVVPTSKPKIVSSGSECVTTGSRAGFITATIKNVGDDYATFFISADCPSPFSQAGNAVPIQLAPDTQGIVNIPVTGAGIDEIKKECTITAVDSINPSNKDIASQEVCVKPKVLCDSGETACRGAVKIQCNTAGSDFDIVEGDETCRTIGGGGGEACKHYLQIGKAVIIPKLSCLKEFKTIRWIASILVGVFILFIVYGATASRLRNQKGEVDNLALVWTISIIFGIGSAIITYLLFYVGLTILLIALLIGIIIRVKKQT